MHREYQASEVEESQEDLYTVSGKDLDAIEEVKEEEVDGTFEEISATAKPAEVEGRRWRLRKSRRVSFEADIPWITRRASSNFPPHMKKLNRKRTPFQIQPGEKSSFPEISSLGAKSQMKERRKSILLNPRSVPKHMYRGSSFKQAKGNRVKVHVELNPRALENILDDFDIDRVNTSTKTRRITDDFVNNCSTEENCRTDQKSKKREPFCPEGEYRGSSSNNVEIFTTESTWSKGYIPGVLNFRNHTKTKSALCQGHVF